MQKTLELIGIYFDLFEKQDFTLSYIWQALFFYLPFYSSSSFTPFVLFSLFCFYSFLPSFSFSVLQWQLTGAQAKETRLFPCLDSLFKVSCEMFLQHFPKTLIAAVYVDMIHSIIGAQYKCVLMLCFKSHRFQFTLPQKAKMRLASKLKFNLKKSVAKEV